MTIRDGRQAQPAHAPTTSISADTGRNNEPRSRRAEVKAKPVSADHVLAPCHSTLAELNAATVAVDLLISEPGGPRIADPRRRDSTEVVAAIDRMREANVEWRRAVELQGC
jgi:hypothetical protein